jgi:hypothetical protein
MIVMREIMNAKQTQVHPCNSTRGACGGLVQSRSRHPAEQSPYRINDPRLSRRLEANTLIEQGFEAASDIGPVKRAWGDASGAVRNPRAMPTCRYRMAPLCAESQNGSKFSDTDVDPIRRVCR